MEVSDLVTDSLPKQIRSDQNNRKIKVEVSQLSTTTSFNDALGRAFPRTVLCQTRLQTANGRMNTQEKPKSNDDKVGYRLDPSDWKEYRAELHKLVDACCDRMEAYRNLPWQPPPADLLQRLSIEPKSTNDTMPPSNTSPSSSSTIQERLTKEIMPYATGNTHPQFFGWVHGAGIPALAAAELVAATMNSNCGGRNHGAAAVEQACIAWLCQQAGFVSRMVHGTTAPTKQPFGVLTSGTSQATLLALSAARTRKFGCDRIRHQGIAGLPPVRLYVSQAAHTCLTRAMECLGYGSASVVRIPVHATTGAMEMNALRHCLQRDVKAGLVPLALVGTAGSVTVGAYDDLEAMADLANEYDVWFHVDAAFGFWTRVSSNHRIRNLSAGAHRADSMALDAHKWPGVNYDCGALLVKDKEHLRQTLAMRPPYLQSCDRGGLASGDVWYTDYSLDLSRGFRALKLWTALTTAGVETIGQVVTDHCALASQMADLVEKSPLLELAHPVISNICCFYIKPDLVAGLVMPTAADVTATLQLQGKGVFSTVKIHDKDCLRAAIVNHRTTPQDIENGIAAVEEAVRSKIWLKREIN